MSERMKRNGKAFLIGCAAGMFASMLLFVNTGCSTVKGFGQDLMNSSDGLKHAMTQDDE